MRYTLLVPALLAVACSAPAALSPAPAPTVQTQVRATLTTMPTLLPRAAVGPAPTVISTRAPTPTLTLAALIENLAHFPYASAVGRDELPPNRFYRVADVSKTTHYWNVKLQSPLARGDPAQVMSVLSDATDHLFATPEAPRALILGVYSVDPIVAAKSPFTADPDLAEAFVSSDGRGLSGDGGWPSNMLYAFETPFTDTEFRDEGKLYVAIPVYKVIDGERVPVSMNKFAVDR